LFAAGVGFLAVSLKIRVAHVLDAYEKREIAKEYLW
jgi:hypothetical protein